jgi:hypothetical protein
VFNSPIFVELIQTTRNLQEKLQKPSKGALHQKLICLSREPVIQTNQPSSSQPGVAEKSTEDRDSPTVTDLHIKISKFWHTTTRS